MTTHIHTIAPLDAPQSSVEIQSRAKGSPAITVKVYHPDPDIAATEAVRIYADVLTMLARYEATAE